MAGFDLAISIDQETINGVIASLYQRPDLRRNLFRGTHSVPAPGGAPVTVSYDVQQPPTIALWAPTPYQWRQAVKGEDATGAEPPVFGSFVAYFQ
jgi:hypothetical protein